MTDYMELHSNGVNSAASRCRISIHEAQYLRELRMIIYQACSTKTVAFGDPGWENREEYGEVDDRVIRGFATHQ